MKTLLFVAAVLICCVGVAEGGMIFDDGGTHNIDYILNEELVIRDSSGGQKTTVNILSGGSINFFTAYDNSQIDISGG